MLGDHCCFAQPCTDMTRNKTKITFNSISPSLVSLPKPQDSSGTDSSHVLENVVEQLVHFRSNIRNFALEPMADGSPGTSGKKKQLHPDRLPLLKACDVLRKDLAPLGVDIKVSMYPQSIEL